MDDLFTFSLKTLHRRRGAKHSIERDLYSSSVAPSAVPESVTNRHGRDEATPSSSKKKKRQAS